MNLFNSLLFSLSVLSLCAWRGVDAGGGETEDEPMPLTQTTANKEGRKKSGR